MRPGARLWAAIELLDLIDAERRPADMMIRDYFRSRRYAGSGDRRRVGEIVFNVLRRRGELDWRLAQAGLATGNTERVLLTQDTATLPDLVADTHFQAAPDAQTLSQIVSAGARSLEGAPDHAVLNLPEWLIGETRQVEELDAALSGRAATDLRVNTLSTDRETVKQALAEDGVETEDLDLVPHGLRLKQATRLEDHPLYQSGHFEIQDAGSQLVGHLVGAPPGARVADICAGAGGKTLLLAADMANQGQIFASDIDARRLRRLQDRANRAGISCLTVHQGGSQEWPGNWLESMDRVLIDAPCSGSGTWRRQPEQRWRLTPQRLDELARIQQGVLDRAASLVRPGGTLVYVTCSLLDIENETAVTHFLDRNPAFTASPWHASAPKWLKSGELGDDPDGPFLRISTLNHGTDNFFAAVMHRTMG